MSNDLTIQLVSLALDAALMRETAIANNVANINTKGYQAMEVQFEEQLKNTPGENRHEIQPVFEQTQRPTSLDEQMALSIKNATQYRALIKGLNHKLAMMALALQSNNT